MRLPWHTALFGVDARSCSNTERASEMPNIKVMIVLSPIQSCRPANHRE